MKMGNLSDPLIRSIDIIMPNKLGFHLRVVARFVLCVRDFRSSLSIRKGSLAVDGKSMMGLLILGAAWKSKLEIEAVGDDAVQTIESIRQFFLNHEDITAAV